MIKPLYEYTVSLATKKQIELWDEMLASEKLDNGTAIKKGKLSVDWYYIQFILLSYEIMASPPLVWFIINGLCNSHSHIHLYAHALKHISMKEEKDLIDMKMFFKYFKEGFPDHIEMRDAWRNQFVGGINLLTVCQNI